jgi:hypothetical protein
VVAVDFHLVVVGEQHWVWMVEVGVPQQAWKVGQEVERLAWAADRLCGQATMAELVAQELADASEVRQTQPPWPSTPSW